jgi:hypothetical protein
LDVSTRSDEGRAALIHRLTVDAKSEWLAEILMDLEDETGEAVRIQLIESLRRRLPRSVGDESS